MNNDFLGYIGLYSGDNSLQHSAKGTSWKNHKYIKKENGRYYYPGDKSGNSAKKKYYSKGDPDFDEANYDDRNRLGDTDFYGFTRPDGTFVILEEDTKWEIPNGKSINKDQLAKSLENFDKRVSSIRKSGQKYSSDEWERDAEKAINGSTKKAKEDISKNDLRKVLTKGRR